MATPVRLMLGVTTTRAESGSTTPGTATPTAARSQAATLPFFSMSSMTFSTTASTCSGPPVRGVVCRSRWRIPPDSRTNVACTFVPPMSTPR